MKKYLSIMIFVLAALSIVSCSKKDSEGLTRTTYYPSIEILGDAEVTVQKGSTYTDAGCKATVQGEDITSQVQTVSNVNTAKSGVYSVSYTVLNSDGFAKTASRTVYVLDLTDPIEGFYTTTDVHTGTSNKYNGPWSTLIIKQDDGNYSISDFLGGWYAQGRGYGSPKYDMTGTFSLEGTSVSLIDSYIAGWGDGLDGMENGTYNPEAGTFYWEVGYAGSMTFYVTIQKN